MFNQEIFHLLTQEYSLILVSTHKHIEAVKTIRREILLAKYKEKTAIEDEEKFLFNEDDEQSFIYLLRHNPTQKNVGTIRLFFINASTPSRQLPMQKYGNVKDITHFTEQLPICEVSRLALSNDLPTYKDFSALQLRTSLTIGLMSTIGINIFLYPYKNIFSIMDPSLHRILRRQGINFEAIGDAVDYYGMAIPYAIERNTLIDESKEILTKLTQHYLTQLVKDPSSVKSFIENNAYLQQCDLLFDQICHCFKTHGKDIPLSFLSKQLRV